LGIGEEQIFGRKIETGQILMENKCCFRNQKGFTLIELISVMVIMGVMSSVAVKKIDFITDTASSKALAIALKELNVRESLVWSKLKISIDGYTTDADLFSALDKDLGAKFKWNPGPAIDGGTLHFESQSIILNRIPSTNSTIGKWQ
jgi:prepilin-type N-terminal cleavage/methylation domain-containing protein